MIEIKPSVSFIFHCPVCGDSLSKGGIIWQGIHVCIETRCGHCAKSFLSDLPVGHGVHAPFHVEKNSYELFGQNSRSWLGTPLQHSLKFPDKSDVKLKIVKKKDISEANVVILNCIDYLYGHSLLKLLNASRHLNQGQYVVVIVQKFLTWLVPDDVAEIWEVDLSLDKSLNYYPDLDKKISLQLTRFESVQISKGLAHPKYFNIEDYSGVSKFKATSLTKAKQVLFVWREERLWIKNEIVFQVFRKLKLEKCLLLWQRRKVVSLFKKIRKNLGGETQFVVAGLGMMGQFPEWIIDKRVAQFDENIEKVLCDYYAKSDLVIGVHGSNMLLPSAHANMVLDIMPKDRWGNITQDVIYQENDNRMTSFRIRYIPIEVKVSSLALIAQSMIDGFEKYKQVMLDDHIN